MKKGKWASRLGRAGVLVAIGALVGSVMLTPVGAHITNFNHLKTKHFYTKKAANVRFYTKAATNVRFYTKGDADSRFVNTDELETKVVYDTTAALETTSSTSFVDVPGASTSITVPAGTTALILVRFTAESACYGNANENCSVRILIGGTEANPAVGADFAFDTDRDGDNQSSAFTGEALGIERSRSGLAAGTYEVKVQFLSVGATNTAQLDDWHLTVQRITTG